MATRRAAKRGCPFHKSVSLSLSASQRDRSIRPEKSLSHHTSRADKAGRAAVEELSVLELRLGVLVQRVFSQPSRARRPVGACVRQKREKKCLAFFQENRVLERSLAREAGVRRDSSVSRETETGVSRVGKAPDSLEMDKGTLRCGALKNAAKGDRGASRVSSPPRRGRPSLKGSTDSIEGRFDGPLCAARAVAASRRPPASVRNANVESPLSALSTLNRRASATPRFEKEKESLPRELLVCDISCAKLSRVVSLKGLSRERERVSTQSPMMYARDGARLEKSCKRSRR